MKPQDLRIGNWVVLDWTGDKHSLNEEVQILNFQVLKEFETGDRQYSGILLTEEWLEKFGLIKKYLKNPFEEGGYDLKEDGNRWYSWVDKGTFNLEIQTNGEIWFEIYSCYRHIQYVHELQNLYFSLTGKELTIKKYE